jgi:hypothetical protein
MKIKLGFIIIMTFLSSYSFGQFELGVKGGININSVKTTDIPSGWAVDFNSIIGFHVGLFTQIDLNEKFHLNSDLLFTRRGYEVDDSETTIDYLEIPILLSYSIMDNLEVELGPDLGLKISEQSDISGIDYESIDFGPTIGLRYNLTDKIILSSRYYYGLTSIAGIYAQSISGGTVSKSFNRVLQFTLGYKLL